MAEFENVMAGYARMCKYMKQDCYDHHCPLAYKNFCTKPVHSYTAEDIQEAEEIIAKWVAKHPEPEYPTWGEWLAEQGLVGCRPGFRDDKIEYCLTSKVSTSISADIAEKLGIEPKR